MTAWDYMKGMLRFIKNFGAEKDRHKFMSQEEWIDIFFLAVFFSAFNNVWDFWCNGAVNDKNIEVRTEKG